MKRGKKFLKLVTLLLSISILFQVNTVNIFASNSAAADKLIDELCRKINTNDPTVNESDIVNKMSKIGLKLEEDDPLLSRKEENNGLPKFNPFPTNVYIFVFDDSVTVKNVVYPLKVFWVIPKDGSNLIRKYDAFNVYKEPVDKYSFGKKILKIYRDKAIGTLVGANPIISWSPYELLLDENKKNFSSANRYEISVDLHSYMKYVYYYIPQTKSWSYKLSSQVVFGREEHNIRFTTKDGLPDYTKNSITRGYAIKGRFFTNYKTLLSKLIPAGSYPDRVNDLYYYDVSNKSKKLVQTVTPPYAEHTLDLTE